MDPGGYDAYRVEKRFIAPNQGTRADRVVSRIGFGLRSEGLTDAEVERVRGGGWDLPTLQKVVNQFVIHFDVAGQSRTCFKVLHDVRGLSVHFMLDLDGTLYQTLDLKEGAWHASSSNDRSIGIEIANIGAYSESQKDTLKEWYQQDASGHTIAVIPPRFGTNTQRTANFVGHPARREMVSGEVQGKILQQYDFTPPQYEALAKLTATLCTVFPKIKCDYPRDASGKVVSHKLPHDELKNYQGVLGHFHVQTDKVDPGPAFQWDYVIGKARQLMETSAAKRTVEIKPVKLLRDN